MHMIRSWAAPATGQLRLLFPRKGACVEVPVYVLFEPYSEKYVFSTEIHKKKITLFKKL